MPSKEKQPNQNNLNKGLSMRVLWTVSDYRIVKDSEMKEEEARKMLFKPLDIGESYITFDGKRCSDVFFKRDTVNTKEYLHNTYNITPQALNIDDNTVDIIKTNCNLPGFDEYMRLKDRKLVIHIKGVFFFFEPNVAY